MLNTALVKGIFPIDVAHGGLGIFPAHMLHQRSQIPPIRSKVDPSVKTLSRLI